MTTLNNNQQRSYSIAQQLASFLRKSKRMYNNVAPFSDEVTAFLHNLEDIPAQAVIKAKKGMSLTIQKRENKKEIARKAAHVCNLATAFAITTNNKELRYSTNFTYTDIYTTKDTVLQFRITSIVNAVTPLLGNEKFKSYSIKADDLASLTGKTKQFTGSIHCARFLNRDSEYASRTITAALKRLKANITQMNRLLILCKEAHPNFITGFQQALVVEENKQTHNTIQGIIKDSITGQPIEKATITAEGKNKTTVTNAAGFYYLSGIKAGTHNITITAEGYAPQTIEVRIIRGKTTEQNIVLKARLNELSETKVA